MSERLQFFEAPSGPCALALRFDIEDWIAQWQGLRSAMVRGVPAGFERDEWAYLVTFLEAENLRRPFTWAFGRPCSASRRPTLLARPREPVAVWLPSNVSLLGPLVLVLLSLTGACVELKAAAEAEDLAGAFLAYCREQLGAGSLREHLVQRVRLQRFDRNDPRNAELAERAAVRVMFGADASLVAIDSLQHPLESRSFPFATRRSEAWIEAGKALDEATLTTLIRVFAIYGQAGCTAPARVRLLGADLNEAHRMGTALAELWPRVVARRPAPHVASENVMLRQCAAALGWRAATVEGNAAVVAVGEPALEPVRGLMALSIQPAAHDSVIDELPPDIQTVGHVLEDPDDPRWLERVARSPIKRFVPLARMHHFGPVWDGWAFWRELFEVVDLGA